LSKHSVEFLCENARLTTVYETDMYRLYLVKCMESKRMDKCNQFFLKCASLTQNNPTWAEWFAFPYHPKPEGCQAYRKYYSHEWREIFVISLHNFVRIAIQSAPHELMDDFAVIAQYAFTTVLLSSFKILRLL
uniref:COPI_C domain-containing protein n=1 Tax=Haemonchus placei TaxID=6290 RepID=A0A0N4WJH8_HAEPC